MEYTLKEFKNTEGLAFEALTFNGNELAEFLIEWRKIEDHYVELIVHEVTSWAGDKDEPCDYGKYVKAYIKWDGCSHLYFGEGEPADGYLHLCGKSYFDKHCNLLQALWDICSKKIKSFDHEVAS